MGEMTIKGIDERTLTLLRAIVARDTEPTPRSIEPLKQVRDETVREGEAEWRLA